jgi:hypothetical protein
VTWGNAGPHSAEPSIPDKDEVPGSSPGRPTTHRRRSEHCRHRAGRVRCRLGPRWGRTPIPRRHLPWPLQVRPPGRPARRRPHSVVKHPARGRPPRGGCSHLARPPAPVPTTQPPATGAPTRRPGLPGRSAGTRGRRGPHQPAARVRRRPPTGQRDLGSVARVSASATIDRAVDGPAATGPPPVPVVTVARPPRPGSHRHRLSMGGDGRVRTDGGRQQTAGHRTGGQQTAGRWMGGQQTAERRTRWTTIPGDRTPDGWTAGSRTPNPDEWTPHAGHRRPTPWRACWQCRPRRRRPTPRYRLDAPLGRRRLASNNQDYSATRTPGAPTLLRTGLATAATVSCRWYAAVQLAPWRTAVLG